MEANKVIESFKNAWRAMVKFYHENPDENMRCALNLLSKIIGKVETEVNKEARSKNEIKQFTIDDWIKMLEEMRG
ncbi:hypothetical protein [[Clostridium] polysaccharolyticum]|uniref:Uncharacterized protein n=1 Tax=[Clostridium] polysaccharolyticum TaxID=29364 RepID=A0A1H9YJ10_9FIRM|nr:hypothetical protein [[Clostridium] polysaccharolyticum]SES69060.1 hypothetical protein SAMN04487772_10247 [[Clostridium] polysaccharolyticum]